MKTAFLTLFTLLFIAFIVSRMAKYVARKVMQDYDNHVDESEQYSYFPPSKETSEEIKLETKDEEEQTTETSGRIVISVTNDSSSSKKQTNTNESIELDVVNVDYNDVQNLSSVNKNVYRAKNGRFKSIKS